MVVDGCMVLCANSTCRRCPNTKCVEMGAALEQALDPPTAEEVETRTYDLGKIYVAQSVKDSVWQTAVRCSVAMKNRIKELVAMGYSDDQIIDYFIGRYGEFVLLQPKSEHWFVW